MKAPFYIISDNHFMMNNSKSEQSRRNKLFKVFDLILKKGDGTLIIGGDFFDFWFETKNIIPNGYTNLIARMQELTNAGIPIHYLAGNHDYWDFGYLKKQANIIFHREDLYFNFNNQDILITHGDGLLKNDYGYRFMKNIIRHKAFINLFSLIPPKISFKIAQKISKSSSDYNHHDKYVDIIIADVTKYAQQKWKENIDIVMVGHYHQNIIIKENNHSLVFLGDWLSKFTVTTLTENGLWQGNYKEFIKLS